MFNYFGLGMAGGDDAVAEDVGEGAFEDVEAGDFGEDGGDVAAGLGGCAQAFAGVGEVAAEDGVLEFGEGAGDELDETVLLGLYLLEFGVDLRQCVFVIGELGGQRAQFRVGVGA